jgi:translation initiation factor IF-3
LEDVGIVENRPKMEGNNLVAIFSPQKDAGKAQKAPDQPAS